MTLKTLLLCVGGVVVVFLAVWAGWRKGDALRTLDQDDHEEPPRPGPDAHGQDL